MKKREELLEITAMVKGQISTLKNLSTQVLALENSITTIASRLNKFSYELEAVSGEVTPEASIIDFIRPELKMAAGYPSNIIPFPGAFHPKTAAKPANSAFRTTRPSALAPIIAAPGKPLPAGIPDFRPVLQRNGLILLAWDKRKTENGELYSAYWVTSSGVPRHYASKPYLIQDFPSAYPDHKSYAAEDGIEFFGQDAPSYIVHVAPELMKSNPRHKELRITHINTLIRQGSKINFNYKYLLSDEKKIRFIPERSNNNLYEA